MAAPDQNFQTVFRSEIRNRYGDSFRVNIQQDGFTGSRQTGPDIIELRIGYGARGRTTRLIGSRCRIRFHDPTRVLGNAISLAKDREWRITIRDNALRTLIWEGYVLPSNIEQGVSDYGRMVSLEATDGTTTLHDYVYDGPAIGRYTVAYILSQGFRRVNTRESTIRINNTLTPYASTPLAGHETLSAVYIDVSFLAQRTWGEIIDELMQRFGLMACYHAPGFVVVDMLSLAESDYSLDYVDEDGDRTSDAAQVISTLDDSTYNLLYGATVEALPGVKQANVGWYRGYDEGNKVYAANSIVNPGFDTSLADWTLDAGGISIPPGHVSNIGGIPDDAGVALTFPVRTVDNEGTPYNTNSAPPVNMWQDLSVPGGEEYFGVRFSCRLRLAAWDPDPLTPIVGSRVDWALRHTSAGGTEKWWNESSNAWQTDEVRNTIEPTNTAWMNIDLETERYDEPGDIRLYLYEGFAFWMGDRPQIEQYQWDDVSVQVVGAISGQRLELVTSVEDTDAPSGDLIDVPDQLFTYGSAFSTLHRRALSLDASGNNFARGWKVGRYSDGETTTNATIDEALGRHILTWRGLLGKQVNAVAKLSSAVIMSPATPIVYESENYILQSIESDLLERFARIVCRRVKTQTLSNVKVAVISETDRRLSSAGVSRITSPGVDATARLPENDLGVLWRAGDPDDDTEARAYQLTGLGSPGQVLGVVDGDPDYVDWVQPAQTLPAFGVAQANLVLKVNSMGDLVWATDEIGSAGSVLPPKAGHEGKVLKIVSDTVTWADDADTDTTYTAGDGLTLTGTAFSVDNPALDPADGMAGQVMKINADANGLVWADDANTTYTAGSGLTLTGTAFSVDNPVSKPTEDDHRRVLMAMDADPDNPDSTVSMAWTQIAYTDISGTPTIPAATTSLPFTAITGMIADGQIPAGIARDTELPSPGTGITADGVTWNIDVPVPAFADQTAGYVLKIIDNAGTKSIAWAADTDTNTDTDTDTTYTAGTGLALNGTVFSHATASFTGAKAGSSGEYVTGFTIDSLGHVTDISYATPPDTNTDTDTTYTAGTGLTLTGTVFSVSYPFTAAIEGRIPTGSPGANKVWKTDADGAAAWRDDAVGMPGTGEANVQANWTETDSTSDQYILNKPTAGAGIAFSSSNVISVDLSGNNSGLQFNNMKLRIRVNEGVKRNNQGLSHGDTGSLTAGAQSSTGQYVQGFTVDKWGHVTAISYGTPPDTNTDTDTTYTAGTGLTLTGTVFAVANPISAAEIGRIPTASPGNNKVWKTDGSGTPGWRDDASGSGADGNDYVTAGAYSAGTITLTVSNQDDVTITGLPTSFTVAFSDLTGSIALTQIPATIARTSDIITSEERTAIGRIPTAPTNSEGSKVWKTDSDGNPAWRDDEVGMPGTGEANVQSDWTNTDDTSDQYILNKPTEAIARIPSAPVEADHRKVWMALDADPDAPDSSVAGAWTQIAYADISGTPTIPAATTSLPFTAITGMIADGQIPAGIARDTELPSPGTGITADGVTWNIDVPVPALSSASGGQVLKVKDTDGTLTIEWADDVDTDTNTDTTYTAGDGLTLTGTVFSITYGSGDAGKVLKVNGEGNAVVWADDADTNTDTTYTAGAGMSLSAGNEFSVDNPISSAEIGRIPTGSPGANKVWKSDADGAVAWRDDADTNTDTTYTAGDGLTLTGTVFSITYGSGDAGKVLKVNGEGDAVVWADDADTNTDTTYTAGTGLTLTGTVFAHASATFTGTKAGSAGQYVTGFTIDTLGHVSGISYGTPPDTNTDTDTTYTAGNGLTLTGTVFTADGHTGITVSSDGIAVTEPYTAAERTKLATVETNAKDDQTGPEIVSLLTALTTTSRLGYAAIKDTPTTWPWASISDNPIPSYVKADDGKMLTVVDPDPTMENIDPVLAWVDSESGIEPQNVTGQLSTSLPTSIAIGGTSNITVSAIGAGSYASYDGTGNAGKVIIQKPGTYKLWGEINVFGPSQRTGPGFVISGTGVTNLGWSLSYVRNLDQGDSIWVPVYVEFYVSTANTVATIQVTHRATLDAGNSLQTSNLGVESNGIRNMRILGLGNARGEVVGGGTAGGLTVVSRDNTLIGAGTNVSVLGVKNPVPDILRDSTDQNNEATNDRGKFLQAHDTSPGAADAANTTTRRWTTIPIGRIPAVGVASKVWKTDGDGTPGWRDEAGGTNNYVTSGSYSAGTITLQRTGLAAITITGLPTGGGAGDITGVTAGAGLSGGGTTGDVTLTHATPSSVAGNTTNTGNTFVQSMTFDAYGHVTGVVTGTATTGGTGGANNYVTSGSYSNGTITLQRSGLSAITITGLPTGGGTTELPNYGSAQNGRVLKVVNGVLAWGTDDTGTGSLPTPPAADDMAAGSYVISVRPNAVGADDVEWIAMANLLAPGGGLTTYGIVIEESGRHVLDRIGVSAGTGITVDDSGVSLAADQRIPAYSTSQNGRVLGVASGALSWLTRLAGPKGDKGDPGAKGDKGDPGDITGVTAGNGLTGGGTSGSVTLSHQSGHQFAGNKYTGGVSTTTFGILSSMSFDTYGHKTLMATRDINAGTGITFSSAGGGALNINASGSDRRLKKDIAPLTGALALARQLKPSTFAWAVNDGYPKDCKAAGFIAQDIETIFPRAVCMRDPAIDPETGKPTDDTLHLNIHGIVAINTAAIQDIDNEIDALKKRVAVLEAAKN